MIIGLSGLKQSGKDTVAAYLVKEHGFERRAFADPLKRSVAALLDIPFHEIEQYKNDKYALISFTAMKGKESVKQVLTFRSFLQRYGTEAHRDIEEMTTDFWVNLTLPLTGYYSHRNIVISDVRFRNEATRIHSLNGAVIMISRSAAPETKDQHRSETEMLEGIKQDYEIRNDGTVEQLYEEVDKIMAIESES